jgi:SanA protein
MTFRRILKGLIIIFVLVAAFILISNIWIIQSTENSIFSDVSKVPYNDVALVLGTSNKLTDGSPNPFFENRIRTAAVLYHQKKVSHFILSGDNRSQYYNEPFAMKRALMKLGVPDSAITLDYAGMRTLDSVVRSKEIFGQDKLTIITQSFHSYRALFISGYYKIDAIAIITHEQPREDAPIVYWREYLARTKAVLDLYILKTAPRYLGDKEHLDI